MKSIAFHFDPISPFAWLAFQRLPQVLEGLSHRVTYRPLLLGGVLAHWGQQGPAELAPKRDWTYRHVAWLAQQHGIELQLPAQHPFNPLALLRLLLATAPAGATPGRWACEEVLHHVWCGQGADANDPTRLADLTARLAPQRNPQGAEVKQELKAATAAAITRGVFGVPTMEADGRLFWGHDALPMLADHLHGGAFFAGSAWADAAAPRPALSRRPSPINQLPAGQPPEA